MTEKTKKTTKKSRRKKLMVRNGIIIACCVLICVSVIWQSNSKSSKNANKLKPTQETEEIKKGDLTITVKASGNLEAWEKIDLRPEASGKVEKLFVDEGDIVTEGQVVALLDQTSQLNTLEKARSYVAQAKANLDQIKKGYRSGEKVRLEEQIKQAEIRLREAEREYNSQKDLLKDGFTSQQQYDNAKANFEQAKSEVESLKKQLKILLDGGEKQDIAAATAAYEMALADLKEAERMLGDASVVAPMSGVVLKRFVTEGSVILSGMSTFSQGEAILSIGDIEKMKMIAQVDEGDIEKVKLNQKVLIEVDAYPDEKFEGAVTKIAPQGTSAEATMTTFGVTVEINNADGRLKPGFTADVEIIVEEVKDVILVPFRAVLQVEEKYYVFVVDDKDVYSEREVKVDRTNYEFYELLSGATEGEKVITKGRPSKLKGGKEESKVKIQIG
jgi:HlyD family secretion protein